MTPKPKNLCSGLAGAKRARLAYLSLALLGLLGGEAGAAAKTYRYFRFQPTRMQTANSGAALSEFTFSYQGALLNLNNRDATGVAAVPVTATFGSQSNTPPGNIPNRVFDGRPLITAGSPATRWVSGTGIDPLTTPLEFTFNSEVTVDSYNFATESESSTSGRTPVSWFLYGKKDGPSAQWELIDARANMALNFANNTYQAGFTIPDSVSPSVNFFRVVNTPSQGTAAIVRNDDPNGVKLEWDATLGDTTVSPPSTVVPLTGSGNFDPPDNATTTFTFTAALGSQIATKTTIVRSVAGGTSTYRYLRFKATKLRNGTATGLVQISEFGFLNNGNVSGVNAVTNPGGDNPANELVGNLIDGSNTNKWLDRNNGYVIFDLGEPTPPFDENQVTHYFFVTGNDATERDPLQWTLEGSNDETTWTLVENVNFDYPTTTTRNASTRVIPLPGASLPPSINYYYGSAGTVYEGSAIQLSWSVNGAETISIDQGVGTVNPEGTITVTPPLGTTIYTLSASSVGNAATTTNSFTVNVLPGPAPNGIDFADFSSGAEQMSLHGSSSFVGGKLQLTPDTGSQQGEAWHVVKQPVAGGFEATFGLSMTHVANQPADGVSFVIQNHPQGSNAPSTGETGVASNSLNICFLTYGANAAEASRIEVRTPGNTVAPIPMTVYASNKPGITYKGITNYPYPTLTGMPGSEPYRIRVVYTPDDEDATNSKLDVYVNEVAVIQNLEVDLEAINAVDAQGKAFVGFAGRTGSFSQLNQITYFHMRYGDFSALPPFGIVKSFRNTMIAAAPTWDLVWDAVLENSYEVQSSDNLVDWDTEASYGGEEGQIGHRFMIDNAELHRFYRVVEQEP